MRCIRITLLVVLTSIAAACSAITEPATHHDTTCTGGSSEWTKCGVDTTHT